MNTPEKRPQRPSEPRNPAPASTEIPGAESEPHAGVQRVGIDDLSLADIRRELHRLTAIASSAERPKPTRINGPGHPMPGHEWDLREQAHPHTRRDFVWIVRTADEQNTADGLVYVSTPESMYPGEDFTPLYASDARRLAMALLAAADRADHQALDIPRLEDRRRPPQLNPDTTQETR